MNSFDLIPESNIILRRKGVFSTSRLYNNHGTLFAKSGSGFVKLKVSGETSSTGLFWQDARAQGGTIDNDKFYLIWRPLMIANIAAE